jgi:hypothetical protein
MGSVKSGEAFYGGVQGADDDFEASGMGWVKKRKEERAKKEREAKEREERERRDAEVQRDVERRHEGVGGHEEKETSKANLPKIVVHSSETEHVCRTVSVPHHHHSRHPSRTNSIASSGSIPTLSSLGSTIKKSPLSTSYVHTHTHTPTGERPEFVSGSSSSETASASGSGSASVSASSEVEEEAENEIEGSSLKGEDEDDEEDVEEELRVRLSS